LFTRTTMANLMGIEAARCRAFLVCLAVLLGYWASKPAFAEDRFGDSPDQDRAYSARRQGVTVPLGSMMGAARAKGKVLDVQLKGGKYRFKILDENGRVRYVDGDALLGTRTPDGGSSGRGGDGRGSGGIGDASGRGGGDALEPMRGSGGGSSEGSSVHEGAGGRGRSGGR
jgi:hypothetical protein